MRKSPYTGLWTLLAVALAAFVAASLAPAADYLPEGMQRARFWQELTAQPDTARPEVAETEQPDTTAAEPSRPDTDTIPKNILFIGDSMLEGLSPRLAAYADLNGHKLNTVIWYSSTSEVWGSCDTLSHFIARFKPDYIFVCLGSNELFVRDIAAKRAHCVDHILSQIGDIPYVWIGPPNWKPDTGINRLVSSMAAPGTYFMSEGMQFDRTKDGAHPTRNSAALWMDSVARWMPLHCAHPILMETPPTEKRGKPASIILLQPAK